MSHTNIRKSAYVKLLQAQQGLGKSTLPIFRPVNREQRRAEAQANKGDKK